MYRLIAALLMILGSASTASAEVVYFVDRIGQATVPPGYEHYFEEEGATLVLVPSKIARSETRFTFHSLENEAAQLPTIGKDFVQNAARERNKTTFDVTGNGAIAFIDAVQLVDLGDETGLLTGGVMGLDDAFVVFTIGIPEKLADTPDARELVAEGMKELLGGIRRP
jgi:hypothetical protein